jgi:hypothetical protein
MGTRGLGGGGRKANQREVTRAGGGIACRGCGDGTELPRIDFRTNILGYI